MFGRNNFEQNLLAARMKACPLFSSLTSGEIKYLLSTAHLRDYADGEKVFDEGTIGLCFYLIIKGCVRIVAEDDGKQHSIREFKDGEFFSEIHLFSESYHSVSCISGEVTKLVVFTKPDFEELVKIKSQMGNKILLKFLEFFGMKMDELYRENRGLKYKLHQLTNG